MSRTPYVSVSPCKNIITLTFRLLDIFSERLGNNQIKLILLQVVKLNKLLQLQNFYFIVDFMPNWHDYCI